MKILIVDDQESNRRTLALILRKENYTVFMASNGMEALNLMQTETIDLLITDLKMPRLNGLDLIKEAKKRHPLLEIIVTTAYGKIEDAVEAMKMGAWDFITKPIKRADILHIVEQIQSKWSLSQENQHLRLELEKLKSSQWISQSPLMQQLTQEAKSIANSEASILLLGPSGTGKSLLARWIHNHSPRAQNSFISLNCGAIPENLIESELFGHEKGAFTGASRRVIGKFEQASQGTLFLDEVTEMPLHMQVKLLRVLQEGEFERIGGSETITTNARIIAASNQDIEEAVREARFREDLYYRLNVIQLSLPPLSERIQDIPLLAEFFLKKYSQKNNRPPKRLSETALHCLKNYAWPGNVRELENAIQRAVILSRGDMIDKKDLPQNLHQLLSNQELSFPVGTPIKDVEKAMIVATLDLVDGDKTKAAEILGITARTIYRKEAEWKDSES